jgi:outer membrane receptor for ferrienterochelin and colicins
MLKSLLVVLCTLLMLNTYAQRVSGKVYELTQDTIQTPLTGASVFWAGTTLGTVSDNDGNFTIPRSSHSNLLVFSFVGYVNDTVRIGSDSEVSVLLKSEANLSEVVVRGNTGMILDRLSPHQNEIITTRTLAKAACCNLSESFETNASVSVSYSDAVTGAKQIQMLGLSGTYVQTGIENVPSIRGLATTFGLNYVPGTWVHSIDVGKGAGSVVNGYESMTGQINVELHKPDDHERLHFNTYVNNFGRGEINLNLNTKLSEKWSTGLLTHASALRNRIDNNGDGFLDMPLYTQFNGINRWKYEDKNLMAQFGVKVLYEDRLGGQNTFKNDWKGSSQVYGFGNEVKRLEFFSKTAKLFPDKPYKGLGLILSGSLHDSKSYFGTTNYDGRQQTIYGNLIYQSIIGNTNHSYKTGLSFMLDDYNEKFGDTTLLRKEYVPGVFFEYTYNRLDKFVVVAGARLDFHNLYEKQLTPRVHLKYSLDDNTTFRASAGRGFRVANPLAEYYGNLVSSRKLVFLELLQPEVSWNYGVSLTREFTIGEVKGNWITDFYRTNFENQLVADFENPGLTYFYNLRGRAFANSFQTELNLTPLRRLEVKLAYRLLDTKQTLGAPLKEEVLLPKMMVSRDRILFNAGYALPYDRWKLDFTVQWNGKRRMPDLDYHNFHEPVSYANMKTTNAPAFYNLNAQVTRTFPRWDIYLGGENLTNFRQKNPIVDPANPFGNHFDAGMAWGPVVGRMIYAGMRFKITH